MVQQYLSVVYSHVKEKTFHRTAILMDRNLTAGTLRSSVIFYLTSGLHAQSHSSWYLHNKCVDDDGLDHVLIFSEYFCPAVSPPHVWQRKGIPRSPPLPPLARVPPSEFGGRLESAVKTLNELVQQMKSCRQRLSCSCQVMRKKNASMASDALPWKVSPAKLKSCSCQGTHMISAFLELR